MFGEKSKQWLKNTEDYSHSSQSNVDLSGIKYSFSEKVCEVAQLATELKSTQADCKRAKIDLTSELQVSKITVQSLQTENATLNDRHSIQRKSLLSVKEDAKRYADELATFKTESEARILSLIQEANAKESSYFKMEQELSEQLFTAEKELFRLRKELQFANNENRDLKNDLLSKQQQIESWREYIDEKKAEIEIVETYKNEIKQLKDQIQSQEAVSEYVETLKHRLDANPTLEYQNKKIKDELDQLKQQQTNNFLLEEENKELKSKLERYTDTLNKCVILEEDLKEVKERLHVWENQASNPQVALRQLSKLQKENLILSESQSQANSSYDMAKHEMMLLQSKLDQANSKITEDALKIEELEKDRRRFQKQNKLIISERDSLKSVLTSYESELTVNLPEQMTQRTAHLEDILGKYQQTVADLNAEISSLKSRFGIETDVQSSMTSAGKNINQQPSCVPSGDRKLIVELRNQITDLEGQVTKLTDEKELLELRLERHNMQGGYDPRETQVLHFAHNPFDTAVKKKADEIVELREENEKLRQRIKVLNDRIQSLRDDVTKSNTTMNVTTAVNDLVKSCPDPRSELEELQQKLKKEKLRNERQLEIFQENTQALRQLCYKVIGYRLDIPKTNTFKVTSIYASDPEEYLIFTQNSDGSFEVSLDNTYAENMKSDLEWHCGQKSLPVFLASLTTQYVQKTTMMV